MAITLSTAMKNQMLNGVFNASAGINFDSGSLKIYSGTAAGVDASFDASGGAVLVTITLDADSFTAASAGSVSKNGTLQANATGTGTATWFRILQSGDTDGATGSTDERIQGSVSTSGADINLDNDSIASGQQVTITSLDFSL